jgi:aquaporin Z
MTKKLAAEFVGTLMLVLFGCGSAVLAGFGIIGQEGIAWSFGLTIMALFYVIGPISGCHLNPAVSLGVWIGGGERITTAELIGYWIVQILGAVVGAGVLLLIASGSPDFSLGEGLGQNGYGVRLPSGQGSPGDYNLMSCAIFEVVAACIFVLVVLAATRKENPYAGLAIGFTLVVIHLIGIQVTGVSVNPARSIGPAVWVLGDALLQVWLFIAAPLAGAVLAGCLYRMKLLTPDEER